MPTALEDRQALINEINLHREIKDREYADDCLLWAYEQVWTRDEDSEQKLRWPQNLEYLDELIGIYEEEQLIAIPKSRQLLVTWSIAMWLVWRARYRPYNALFIQSDKEEKSAHVVDKRCKFVEDNLNDEWCRRPYTSVKTKESLVGRMTYQRTESDIIAVAQGPDQFRSYVPTVIVVDESEFQDGAHAALTSIMPFTREGKSTKIILVSTSNGPGGVLAGICKEAGFTRWS